MAMGPSTSQRCDAEPLRQHRLEVWALLCLLAGCQATGGSSASAGWPPPDWQLWCVCCLADEAWGLCLLAGRVCSWLLGLLEASDEHLQARSWVLTRVAHLAWG